MVARRVAASTPSEPETGTETVTVACKMPRGIVLQNCEWDERDEAVYGGGVKTVRTARRVGKCVTLNGTALPFGARPSFPIVSGYALTLGVDAAFFRKWMQDNEEHPAVINGLIFGDEDLDTVTGMAQERSAIRSGLEPINPDKPMPGIQRASTKPEELTA